MRKLCWFALPFCAAILAACLGLPGSVLLPVGMAAAILGILSGCLKRLPVCLICLGLAAGLLWFLGWTQLFCAPAQALSGQTTPFSATVLDWPQETATGNLCLEARLHLDGAHDPRILLYLDGDGLLELSPGDTLAGTARFQSIGSTQGETASYYKAQGIFLLGSAVSAVTVEHPRVPSPLRWPVYIARAMQESIRVIFPNDVSGLLCALLTGDKTGLDERDYIALQRSGVAHIAAVSGLHLSFFVGFLSLLFRRPSRLRAALTILLILLFTAVAGFTPSVCRAAFMACMTLLAPLLGRENDGPTTLCAALLALLLVNPCSILSVSLQLSFTSVAGIQLFSQTLYRAMTRSLSGGGSLPRRLWQRLIRLLAANLSVTLGALVLTTPLCAYYFSSVSLIAPLTNLLIIWAVSLLFAPALLLTLLGIALPGLSAALALPVTLLPRYILTVIRALGRLTFASIDTDGVYLCGWLVLAYAMLIWTLLHRDRRPLLPVCALVLTLCTALLLTSLASSAWPLTVTMLDVGQGQCILLRSGGYTALIDCGGNRDNAGDTAANYLQSLGISQVDLLILTHCHSDHANGVPELLNRVEVAALIFPVLTGATQQSCPEEILTQARERGVDIIPLEDNRTLAFGESTLKLYAPLGSGNTNEEGLFVLASCGDFDLLVTGDANSFVESLLVKYGSLPDIEVLVAGHHGSASSTSDVLLDAATPETCLISVGYNAYGHPADETLSRLTGRGIEIYRTDLMGHLTIRCKGD